MTKKGISDYLAAIQTEMVDASDAIWEVAELRFEEVASMSILQKLLTNHGFTVKTNIGGIETAFLAEYGEGEPVMVFLGEYDALSHMSQAAEMTHPTPHVGNLNGHGCGHNLLGVGAAGAAIALRYELEKNKMPGTIRFYGCPGEEGGSGKAFMVKEGLFDDIDVAISWHPNTFNGIFSMNTLANYQVAFEFKGRAAHAAAAPHLGRSALDAVELMNVGVNYLREHLVQDARLHYAVTDTGGLSPNVVQEKAEVLYLMRAPQNDQLKDIYRRVVNIAKGAAMMTDTTVKTRFDKGCSGIVRNKTLEKLMYEQMKQVTLPQYTDAEKRLAEGYVSTYRPEEIESNKKQIFQMIDEREHETWNTLLSESPPLLNKILPYSEKSQLLHGSSDVGDVSHIAPTVQCFSNCYAFGATLHSWQIVSHGKTTIAHKGMMYAAEVMARTGLALLTSPEVLKKAQQEHRLLRCRDQYESLIPDGIKPQPIK
ncbi:amidohydrolase [Bacillus sp. A301a_S52]|nr:amidohydrolase [Bacillus sp. A301a_S52]